MTKITGNPPGTDTARVFAENARKVTPTEQAQAAREFEDAKERVNSRARTDAAITEALQKPSACPLKPEEMLLDHRIILALQKKEPDPKP